MKYLLTGILFSTIIARSQWVTPSVEAVIGSNYYNSVEYSEDEQEYEGVSLYYGLKGKLLLGNRFAITAGGGAKQYPKDGDFYLTANLQGFFYRNYKTGFSAFCEVGGEISGWGGFTVPLFIGTNQYLADGVAFNFRVRIPTYLDVGWLRSADHIEAGIEAGLQFDIRKKSKPKTKFGNPFILY